MLRSAFAIVMCCSVIASLLPARSAIAEPNAFEGPTLVEIVDGIQKLQLPNAEDWERFECQSDLLQNTLALALWTDDQAAIEACEQMLPSFTARAQQQDAAWTRDYLFASQAEMLAYQGKWDQARELAWRIPTEDIRAWAYTLIAIQRARKGDTETYRKELEESLQMLERLIKIDAARPPDERDFIAYNAQVVVLELIAEYVRTDKLPNDKKVEELDWINQRFEKMDLPVAAVAEIRCTLAYGYAALGRAEIARKLLDSSKPLIEQEQAVIDKLPEDDKWMSYGVDESYYQTGYTYAELGDLESAEKTFSKIDYLPSRRSGLAYLGPYYAEKGNDKKALERVIAVVDFAIEANKVVAAGGDALDNEQWSDYTAYDLFWDYFTAAEVAVNVGSQAQLARLRQSTDAPVYQKAIDSGEAWARRRPIVID